MSLLHMKRKTAFNYETRTECLFLDQQPEIESVLKDWLETLNLDPHHTAFGKPKLEDIECRSRDGFSRAGHNFGGFDLEYMADVLSCHGSGCGPDLKEIDRQVDQSYKEAIAWFKDQKFIGVEHLKDDEITYANLHEIGRGELADKLDEIEREWQNSPVWWGVRAMYEGVDAKGVHTLQLYVSGNVCEYYGAHGKGSEQKAEFGVRFKTPSGLKRQLARLKSKVERSI